MKLIKILASITMLVSTLSFAAPNQITDEDEGQIKQKFALLGLPVTSIADSPIDGLLSVFTMRGLFYSTANGDYIIQGRMFGLKDGVTNETEVAYAKVRKQGIKSVEGTTIDFKAKNEKHQVTIFTDITCGYCRKLHNQMDEYNKLGITVRYLAYPRSGLNSQGEKDLDSIWCAADKADAMNVAITKDEVKDKTCANSPVAKHFALGGAFGVTGTPAIVFDDGSMVPGYQSPANLLKALEN